MLVDGKSFAPSHRWSHLYNILEDLHESQTLELQCNFELPYN